MTVKLLVVVMMAVLSSVHATGIGERVVCGCPAGCTINMTFRWGLHSPPPHGFCDRFKVVRFKYGRCTHRARVPHGAVIKVKGAKAMIVNHDIVPAAFYEVRCPDPNSVAALPKQ